MPSVGKSTWAAGAPSPIFLPTEDGLVGINVSQFPVAQTLTEFFSYMDLLINEKNDYQTIVIDTVDWLEKLIWKTVCEDNRVKNIEEIGYGKGYHFANRYWEKFFAGLNVLHAKGAAIVVLAHSEIRGYNPPDGEGYDRFVLKVHKIPAATLEEWADIMLFASFEVIVNAKTKKAINNQSERIIHTTSCPAWKTKKRYVLPDILPLDFSALMDAIKTNK
jgi:hypothetical protein